MIYTVVTSLEKREVVMKYAMIGLILIFTVGCAAHSSSPYVTARNYKVNTAALEKEVEKVNEKRSRKGRATVITPEGIYTIYY